MLANFLIPIVMFFAVTAMPPEPVYDDGRQLKYFENPNYYQYMTGTVNDKTRLTDVLQGLKYGKNRDRFYFGKTDDQRGFQKLDEKRPKVIIIALHDVDSVMDSLKIFMPFMNEDSRLWDSDTFRDSSRYNRDVEKTAIKLSDVLQTLKQGDKKVMFYFGDPEDQGYDQTQSDRKPKMIIITFHTMDAGVDSLRKLMPFMNEETRLLDLDKFRDSNRFIRDLDRDTNKLSDILHQFKDEDKKVRIYVGKTNSDQDEKNKKLVIITLIDVDSDIEDPFQKNKNQHDIWNEE